MIKYNYIEHNKIESHLYTVGDIHGCFDEFIKMTDKILEMDSEAKFILVGDIIDRGPKSLEMLRWAIENVNKPDSKYFMVMGNHEYEKIEIIDKYLAQKEKGEVYTIDDIDIHSYDFAYYITEDNVSDKELQSFKEFFMNLPLLYSTYVMLNNKKKHFIITHAGINSDAVKKDGSINKDKISIDNILYFRNYWGSHLLDNSIIIHGHTPTIIKDATIRGAVPGQAWYNFNDINIDCGLVFRNEYDEYDYSNLCILKLDDLTEYYYFNKKELIDNYMESHGWCHSNITLKFKMLGLKDDDEMQELEDEFFTEVNEKKKKHKEMVEAYQKIEYLFDNEIKTRAPEEQAEIDKAMQEALDMIWESL